MPLTLQGEAVKGTDVLVAADIDPIIIGENMIEKEHIEKSMLI